MHAALVRKAIVRSRIEESFLVTTTLEEILIPIDTYHGHMCEAIKVLCSSFRLLKYANEEEEEALARQELYQEAGIQCRYAFLLAANSLEAAANSLLIGLQANPTLNDDLEKLPTLLKFEVVCMAVGKKLDRGNQLFNNIKEVIRCRNEFVHPKPRMAPYKIDSASNEMQVDIQRTSSGRYSIALEYVTPEEAKNAIGDILGFLSWVVFDVCQFGIEDGSLKLGCGTRSVSGDVLFLEKEYGFDIRTFGEDNTI